eukprot:m.868245 g.868245  ORF g.868245 m.868245 type:complete len:1261 (-) comp23559_c0_seq1:463-4245(-)
MVKVLTVDLFDSGGILPVTSEPVAVTATSAFVLVASTNGLVTAYDTKTGTPLSCFRSRGLVVSMHFCEVTGSLYTLEGVASEDAVEVDYEFQNNNGTVTEWAIRTGPSPTSTVVATLSVGERIVVTHIEGIWVRTLLDPKRVGNSSLSANPGEMIVGWTMTEMDGVQYLRRSGKQDRRTLPRLYYNWRRGTVEDPAVAQVVRQVEQIPTRRTAGGAPIPARKQFSTLVGGSAGDTKGAGDTTVTVVRMTHPTLAVRCVSLCPVTGNVAVASNEFVCVYRVEFDADFPVISKLFTLSPKCTVSRLGLCRDFIGYASTVEAYVLRIGLRWEDSDGDGERTLHGGLCGSQLVPGSVDTLVDDDVTTTHVEDDSRCVSLDFGTADGTAAAASLFAAGVPFPGPVSSQPTANNSSVGSDSPQGDILGPVAVANQGLRGESNSGVLVTSCECYLYKYFGKDSAIHTFTLIPAHTQSLSQLSANTPAAMLAATSPLLPEDGRAGGVCCFLSHRLQGFMYGLLGATRMLSMYSYMQPSNSAAVSDYLLYVTTAGDIGTVETYTIRNVLCLEGDSSNEGAAAAADLPDVSFLESKQMVSPAAVEVGGDRNVVVLVKHRETTFDSLSRADANGHSPENSFNVYYLRTCGLRDLFDKLLLVGEDYKANWPYYSQVLLEGNHLLRAKVGALGGRHFNQDAVEFKSARVKYTTLLQNSCALVADHMLRRVQQAATSSSSPRKTIDGLWDKIVAYYVASHLPLKKIFSRIGAQCAAVGQLRSQDPFVGADLAAVQALCAIARHYVFVPSHRTLVDTNDTALAGDVLHLFWHADYNSLARVILVSTWHTYDTDQAMALVRASQERGASNPELSLAMCLLHLRRQEYDQAAAIVTSCKSTVRAQCVARPALVLVPGIAPGFQEPRISAPSLSPPLLGALLQSRFPELLMDILLTLHGRVSVADAVACLTSPETTATTHSLGEARTVIQYLTETRRKYKQVVSLKPTSTPATVAENTPVAASTLETPEQAMFACAVALCKHRLAYYQAILASAAHMESATAASPTADAVDDSTLLPEWVHAVPLTAPASSAPTVITPPTLSSHAARELVLLQQLLYEEARDSAVATALLDVVLGGGEDFPGRVSLELLCLPAMGRLRDGQDILLRLCPGALVGYCRGYTEPGSISVADWQWMHDALLKVVVSQQENNVGNGTGGVLTAYKKFLLYVAELLQPDDFLQLLPPQGNAKFFMAFMEQSFRQTQIRTFARDVKRRSSTLST